MINIIQVIASVSQHPLDQGTTSSYRVSALHSGSENIRVGIMTPQYV
jgi:hypothetical protein